MKEKHNRLFESYINLLERLEEHRIYDVDLLKTISSYKKTIQLKESENPRR